MRCSQDPPEYGYKAQMKEANRSGARYTLIFRERLKVVLRNMENGAQEEHKDEDEEILLGQIVTKLKNIYESETR